MSLILRCSVCDAKLPNQYAPLGGRCGGYVCKVEIERAIAAAEPAVPVAAKAYSSRARRAA